MNKIKKIVLKYEKPMERKLIINKWSEILFPNTMEYLFIRILGNHLNYNAEKIKLFYMIV